MRHTKKTTPTPEPRHADPLSVPALPPEGNHGDDWLPPTDTTGPRPLDVARQQLATIHMGLAYRIAWRFFRHHFRDCPIDELIAEAMLGLTYAAAMYDTQREVPFDVYATIVIRHRLIHAGNHWRRDQETQSSCVAVEEFAQVPATEIADQHPEYVCAQVRATLPARWYDMLWLYCTEGLTLEQIGIRLGVSKQRAQKIITKAVQRARLRIDGWGSVC